MTEQTTNPYASFAMYWEAGWRGILPLPYQRKTWPPEGYTGHAGADPSYADCFTWAEDGARNIALRMPTNVIGVDVDHYAGKSGGDTLSELVEKHGPLPPTFLSTSREDGISGIRLYRIPVGTVLPTKMPGIDFIQHHHRYAVVSPSIHPEGRQYRWIDERTGENTDTAPSLSDIPELPERWLKGLTVDPKDVSAKADLDGKAAYNILIEMPKGDPCTHIRAAAGRAMMGGDRHDSYNEAVLATLGAGRRGCPGAMTTTSRLHASFISELTDTKVGRATRSEAEAEWQRSMMGALGIVANESQGSACPDDVLDWVESLPPATSPESHVDLDSGEILEETPYDRTVRSKYLELRTLEDAKTMLSSLKIGQAPPFVSLSLTEFLGQPDEEEQYRVDQLWPSEGRVLFAAAAKSGKTTMVAANLIRCLVDGGQFLGRFDVKPTQNRVVFLNMEVGPRTMRRWMSVSDIKNTDKVTVENLRGLTAALTISTPKGRERVAQWLKDLDAEVVILDPLAPVLASLGFDENKNSDVAMFFSWWGETLALAGVKDDLVVHHAGHAGERSRGSSRLLDEPDAVWTLTKDKGEEGVDDDIYGEQSPTRYLSAYGRDVELFGEALHFDPQNRELTLSGMSKTESKAAKFGGKAKLKLADCIPRTKNKIVQALGGDRNLTYSKVEEMISSGELIVANNGKKPVTYLLSEAVDNS